MIFAATAAVPVLVTVNPPPTPTPAHRGRTRHCPARYLGSSSNLKCAFPSAGLSTRPAGGPFRVRFRLLSVQRVAFRLPIQLARTRRG